MIQACGGEFQPAPGDPLTKRTFPLFFDVLRVLLGDKVTVVAEASFQDRLWRSGLEPLAKLAEPCIIQCHVDPAVGLERVARRSAARRGVSRHQVNARELEEWTKAVASFERLSIPAPSIAVDTTDGYSPDVAEIVAFINRQ